MNHSKWSIIAAIAGIGGGLLLTLFSGFYGVYEPVIDGEMMHFGFPYAWLNAGRSGWNNKPPIDWVYSFFWPSFLVDFTIYGLITVAAVFYWTRLQKQIA